MGLARVLGTFDYTLRSVNFTTSSNEIAHQQLIARCCEKMCDQLIDYLTINFDDQFFLYLARDEVSIRFVEGHMSDYPQIVSKVNLGLEGELIDTEQISTVEEVLKVEDNGPMQSDYALLQNSMYLPLSHFEKCYSKAEIYFRPLDETGGDFYWTKDYQYKNLVILGDCTGHGTFGSMIAMAVMTLLKQFFKLPPTSLKHAISGFHEQLQELMEDEVLDVFDVELAILSLDKRTSVLTYVGSGVNTLIKTESGVKQFRSRKSQLILGTVKEEKIQLKKGEQLFVSSDGIYDQFDAENKKRLGSRGFLNMIERAPANNTFNSFMEQFEAFRGEAKQLDDHSMIVLTI